MYLFQCADPIDTQPKHSKNFQARVFWLHCNWHFQNGNVEVALNYLQMVISLRISVIVYFITFPWFIGEQLL